MAIFAPAARRAAGWLFLVSFLSLFVELLLIRWIPSALHVVAFFNNLVLIACFLGLGVGMARPKPLAESAWQASFRLLTLVALIAVAGFFDPSIERGAGHDLNELNANPALRLPLPAVLLAVFALVAWALIPFGEMVAVCFDELERIPAYTVNILGSLAGVLAFAGCSLLELPPLVWFAALAAGILLAGRSLKLAAPLAFTLVCLFLQQHQTTAGGKLDLYWSPYYKVVARPIQNDDLKQGFLLDVNDQFLLSGIDLREKAPYAEAALAAQLARLTGKSEAETKEAAAQQFRDLTMLKSYYEFPFRLRPAKRVLILGSGAGNDIAVALRHGAEAVTAVEIDPRVLALGQAFHPEQPYSSPKTTIVLNDARVYLNRTQEKFDLIIFATLDAHGLLSSVGNVRLDSFIYTKESLALAKSCLAPDGLLVLSFGPFAEATQYRQYATVRSVFGAAPLYFLHRNGHRTLVAGAVGQIKPEALPAPAETIARGQEWRGIGLAEIEAKLKQYPAAVIPATDDWPHLYLREPAIPAEYLWVLGGALALGAALVAWRFRGAARLNGHFFFLGAGFLLMETKSVTEFALLMGSTWQVNVLVFVVILLMILAANLLILTWLRSLPVTACYLALGAGLALGYFLPPTSWATGGTAIWAAALYLGAPIFLAGLIFAATFKEAPLGSAALASNILGSVLGGCTEYLSLAFGLRTLGLLALGMYAASFVCWRLRRPIPTPPA